jgi:hypothetical protein
MRYLTLGEVLELHHRIGKILSEGICRLVSRTYPQYQLLRRAEDYGEHQGKQLFVKMDKDVFPLKGTLQEDFLAVFRKEGLQLKLLIGKPIGFEHQA